MAKRIIKPDSGNTLVLQEDNGSIDALTVETNGDVTLAGNFASKGIDDNASTTAMTIDSSERVLVGTTSAASTQGGVLQVITSQVIRRNINSTGPAALRFEKSRSTSDGGYTIVQDGDQLGDIQFYGADGTDYATGASIKSVVDGTPGDNVMPSKLIFSTSPSGSQTPTERLSIDSSGDVSVTGSFSSGNILAGKTSADSGATAGLEFDASSDKFYVTRSSGSTSSFNRLSTDGEIAGFAKAGTAVGGIGTNSSNSLYVSANAQNLGFKLTSDDLRPTDGSGTDSDNVMDLGNSNVRWNDAYVTNDVTAGSDGRQKQDIEELSEAEQRVALACKGLLRKFRWKDMVAEKGDDARIHFGIIAQDLKAAFEAEGLDAGRYGMFIHSEWWETEETYTDDDGVEKTRINTFDTEEEAPEGAVKKDRMGIRYSELLAFIIAAI